MRPECTSEDECNTAIWFILQKQIINSKISSHIYIRHCHYIHTEQWTFIHNTTYSVHDGSLMPVRTRLLSSWFPNRSLVSSTVADQLLISLLTRWAHFPRLTPFPSGSTYSLAPPSDTLILATFLLNISYWSARSDFRAIFIFFWRFISSQNVGYSTLFLYLVRVFSIR
jgi:hypothetical protein